MHKAGSKRPGYVVRANGSTASRYAMTSATTGYGGDYVDVLHRSDK